jgi:enoyl-CoA hydratase
MDITERKFVQYQIDGRVALITIDHPPVNALSKAILRELDSVFDDLSKRKEIGAVIITGAGEKSFVAGAEISEFLQIGEKTAVGFLEKGQRVFDQIENFDRPVIAAINGFALGGGNELAMACDMRIAAENARFGQPEVNLGIIPGYGGTQRLPRIIGMGKAKEMIFTGDLLSAQEAERLGLVERVVPKGEAVAEAKKLCERIISKGPVAIRMAKKAINEGLSVSLEEGLVLEARYNAVCFGTEDKDEGAKAFFEKRPPIFKGE